MSVKYTVYTKESTVCILKNTEYLYLRMEARSGIKTM